MIPRGLLLRATGVAEGNLALHTLSASDSDEADRVRARRAAVLEPLGLGPADLVTADQVHGARVATVGRREAGGPALRATDALVTREPGVALMVLGADCPLVCLFDPTGPAVAVAHAGWRGLVAGVLEATLEALAPADPERLSAFLSGSAGPCCYEVGEEVAARFPAAAHRRPSPGERPRLDLPAAVAAALPVPPTPLAGCTICGATHYSHRRDATPSRHALLAALPPR